MFFNCFLKKSWEPIAKISYLHVNTTDPTTQFSECWSHSSHWNLRCVNTGLVQASWHRCDSRSPTASRTFHRGFDGSTRGWDACVVRQALWLVGRRGREPQKHRSQICCFFFNWKCEDPTKSLQKSAYLWLLAGFMCRKNRFCRVLCFFFDFWGHVFHPELLYLSSSL